MKAFLLLSVAAIVVSCEARPLPADAHDKALVAQQDEDMRVLQELIDECESGHWPDMKKKEKDVKRKSSEIRIVSH